MRRKQNQAGKAGKTTTTGYKVYTLSFIVPTMLDDTLPLPRHLVADNLPEQDVPRVLEGMP